MNKTEIELNVLTSEISKAAEKYGVDKRFTPVEQLKEILKKSEKQFKTNIDEELKKGNFFEVITEAFLIHDDFDSKYKKRLIKNRILISEEKAEEMLLKQYNESIKNWESLNSELDYLLHVLKQGVEEYNKNHPILFYGKLEDKNGFTITHGNIEVDVNREIVKIRDFDSIRKW